MTDLANAATTTSAADEQMRRIQELQRKRGVGTVSQPSPSSMPEHGTPTRPVPSTTRRRSRAHPAIGARVGAAGLGLVTMFGLVAGMGLSQRSSASIAPAPEAAAPAEVVVVIHRTATKTTGATASGTAVPADRIASPPITLTARPVVSAAAPARTNAAPTAKTNGSR